MDVKVKTLDDYLPRMICGNLHEGLNAVHDLNAWYLCSLTPGHDGDCSTPYGRHEASKEWRYLNG